MQSGQVSKRLQGLSIYMVGIMGSGKSTVGKPLARLLNYTFIDTDKVIEEVANSKIAEIFRDHGESYFRQLEQEVLKEVSQRHSLVIATGGGIVTSIENWGVMRQGIIIWLDLSTSIIKMRLRMDAIERPLITGTNLETKLQELMKNRRPLYAEADLHILPANDPPEKVAQQIIEALPGIIKTPC
uniref:shikimate kinase n=1 Tax=Paulinella micropora TaxID=1928728 RepID=A0A385I002_9EUKA|nr:shikimate kinase [Paulinella micropora]AXY63229.1 shikimate kinase [Paulinella micropora]